MVRAPGKRTETLEIAIVENIQRQDLNAVETARAYARLSDEFGMTQREIAQRLGKSREAIANALRLLSLSGEVQDALAKGAINESQARLLLSVQDPAAQQELFKQLIGENLSVRQLKQRIGQTAQGSAGTQDAQEPALRAQDLQLKAIEKEIAEVVGAPVKIEFSRSGGKIIIHFFSPEEAIGIAERIRPKNAMDM
jgi:ParB family chromosome partitioning protein